MFRSPNEILSIDINSLNLNNLRNNNIDDKQKFILGIV